MHSRFVTVVCSSILYCVLKLVIPSHLFALDSPGATKGSTATPDPKASLVSSSNSAPQSNAGSSNVAVALLVSSAQSDEAGTFSKKLATEFQQDHELAVIEFKQVTIDELRSAAASQHCRYILTVTIN